MRQYTGSGNGLSPFWREAMIWVNGVLLLEEIAVNFE